MTAPTAIRLRLRRQGALLGALLAGALLPLAFAPVSLYGVTLIALALLFALWRDASPGQALALGFAFGLGQFGAGVSWVYVAIHDFGNSPAIVATLLTLLFVALLASIPALAGYLAARLRRDRPLPEALLLLLWLPAWWTLGEWLRGWLFTGFPWLNLGYSLIDAPLRGYAPLVGVYGLTLLVAVSAGALLWLWRAHRTAWRWAVPLLAVVWGGGALLAPLEWTTPLGGPLRVALIQGNQPQLTKWDPKATQQRLRTYAELTREQFGSSDLIVWPENAVTVFYHELEERYFDPLAAEARAAQADLILGVPELDGDGRRYYTTMMSLGSSHRFYRKRHLVPFGEFLPFNTLLRGLTEFFDMPMSSFSPGSDDQPLLEVADQKVAASVCYEDAFGEEIIDFLPEATLLVNGSNNAWYGDSLAPHQHLQISRMRALETGRPMLRATTNGISALIDHHGRLLHVSRQFRTEVIHGTVQGREGATPYVRWGNWPVVGVLLLLLGWMRRRGVKENR